MATRRGCYTSRGAAFVVECESSSEVDRKRPPEASFDTVRLNKPVAATKTNRVRQNVPIPKACL